MHGVREAYRGVNFSHGLQPMSAIRYPPKVRYSEPVSWSMEVGVNWLRKVLPSPIPRLDDHVSIWSVTARDARTFLRIAGSLWLVAFAFIVYQKLAGQTPLPTDPNWRSVGEFLLVVFADLGTVGLGIAIVSIIDPRGEHHGRSADVAVSSNGEPVRHSGDREARGQGSGRRARAGPCRVPGRVACMERTPSGCGARWAGVHGITAGWPTF